MKREIANYLLKQFKAKGADDVVISLNEEQSTQLKISNSKISTTMNWSVANLNVFVAIDKKLISTSIKNFSESAADETVQKLIKFAAAAKPNNEYEGIAEGPFTYKEIDNMYDKKIVDIGDYQVDLVEKGINAAHTTGAKRVAGAMTSTVSSEYLVTSNNVEAEDKKTKIYFSARCFTNPDASGHNVTISSMLDKIDVEKTAIKAAQISVDARNPQKFKGGDFDVLFEPLPFSNLIEQLGSAASSFSVESGLSCLVKKIGTQVASKNFTLTDDGTLPGGSNSSMFDDEGVPTQKNVIVEDGVLKTYLHNTSSAKRYDTKTTANAGIISPSPFNLILKNGNIDKEEMLNSIKHGLWITNTWYTRFQNYETGNFSTVPRDGIFLVENGKIVNSVKDIRISENLLEIMKKVSEIGKEAEQIAGWEVEVPALTPPVLVKNVRITQSME